MDEKPAETPGTAPTSATSVTPRADRVAAEMARRQARGMLLMLMFGEAAALGGCLFAFMHARQGIELAEQFGHSLPVLAVLCDKLALPAFAFPPLVIAGAIVLTRAGKVQRRAGVMLAVILFSFALLWPAVVTVAFGGVFNPPRSQQRRP